MIKTTKATESTHGRANALAKNTSFLEQEEVEIILIQAIRLYKKNQMPLRTLAKLAKDIYQNKKNLLTYSLKKDLAEISSFSVIDTVLNDIQEDLLENEKRRNS